MGFQNFIDGGFIGKVGNVVGQRWKDKRMIRTYVKGTQPNTPAQLESRQLFRIANQLAQQAMNINGHTGIWDTSQKPEYAQRVGLAYKRLRAGIPPEQALPLYPEGYVPPQDLQILSVALNENQKTVTITLTDFASQNPASCKLDLQSPLLLEGLNYKTLQVTPTISGNTIIINTENLPDVMNYFKLGLVAMKFSFFSSQGVLLPDLKVQRNYAITGVLYDFNENAPITESANVVMLRRKIENSKTLLRATKPFSETDIFLLAGFSDITLEGAGAKEEAVQTATTVPTEETFTQELNLQIQNGQIKNYTQQLFYVVGVGQEATIIKQSTTKELNAVVNIQAIEHSESYDTITLKLNTIDADLLGSLQIMAKSLAGEATTATEEKTVSPPLTVGDVQFTGWSAGAKQALEDGGFISLKAVATDTFGETDTGVTFNLSFWDDYGWKTWNYDLQPQTSDTITGEASLDGNATVVFEIYEDPESGKPYWGYFKGMAELAPGSIYVETTYNVVEGVFPAYHSVDIEPQEWEGFDSSGVHYYLMDKDDPNRVPVVG